MSSASGTCPPGGRDGGDVTKKRPGKDAAGKIIKKREYMCGKPNKQRCITQYDDGNVFCVAKWPLAWPKSADLP